MPTQDDLPKETLNMLKQGMVHTVPGFVSVSRDKGLFCERDIIVFRAVQLGGRFGGELS